MAGAETVPWWKFWRPLASGPRSCRAGDPIGAKRMDGESMGNMGIIYGYNLIIYLDIFEYNFYGYNMDRISDYGYMDIINLWIIYMYIYIYISD